MSKKLIIVSTIVALVVGIVIGAMFAPSESNLGGQVRLSQDWFTAGLKAGNTGQISVSSTGVATMATTSVKSLCVYNGTEFTKIFFAAGSTTPAYATSTTCL